MHLTCVFASLVIMPSLKFFDRASFPLSLLLSLRPSTLLSLQKQFFRGLQERFSSARQVTGESQRLVGSLTAVAPSAGRRVHAAHLSAASTLGRREPFATNLFSKGNAERQGRGLAGTGPHAPDTMQFAPVSIGECIEETVPHVLAHAFLDNSSAESLKEPGLREHENEHKTRTTPSRTLTGRCARSPRSLRCPKEKQRVSVAPGRGEITGEGGRIIVARQDAKENVLRTWRGKPGPLGLDKKANRGLVHGNGIPTATRTETGKPSTLMTGDTWNWRSAYTAGAAHAKENDSLSEGKAHERAQGLLFALAAAVMTIHEHKRTLEAVAAGAGIPPALCFACPAPGSASPFAPLSPMSAALARMPWADFTGFRLNLPPVPVEFRLALSLSLAGSGHQSAGVPEQNQFQTSDRRPLQGLHPTAACPGVMVTESKQSVPEEELRSLPVSEGVFAALREKQQSSCGQTVERGTETRANSTNEQSAAVAQVWVLEVPGGPSNPSQREGGGEKGSVSQDGAEERLLPAARTAISPEGRLVYRVTGFSDVFVGVADVEIGKKGGPSQKEELTPALVIETSLQAPSETLHLRAAVFLDRPFDCGTMQREIEGTLPDLEDAFLVSGDEWKKHSATGKEELTIVPALGTVPLGKVVTAVMYRDDPAGSEGGGRRIDVRAPMNGRIIKIEVKEGDRVTKRAPLAVIEAMKMETAIRSPCNGVVASVHVATGAYTKPGQSLLQIFEDTSGKA
ncbi:hypothetical protein BESB_052700 [Besnoitia besnoiti]|uniref:Lipoyl-binding domain-containing protein n=1 Tax=Besnoitia besnoiti TaxID=94643 RepID=A0A2A9MCL3_BESBE|nr:hypothetical protein BESB_052700 [Besnoitia besnoiti]PFH35619.1 hypothetical protein BESB_052700 [Besnoitia besnoiti]